MASDALIISSSAAWRESLACATSLLHAIMRSLASCSAFSAASKSHLARSLRWHALCMRLTGGL
eukprot:5767540-Lingulodinium_polyedra.AAC.1